MSEKAAEFYEELQFHLEHAGGKDLAYVFAQGPLDLTPEEGFFHALTFGLSKLSVTAALAKLALPEAHVVYAELSEEALSEIYQNLPPTVKHVNLVVFAHGAVLPHDAGLFWWPTYMWQGYTGLLDAEELLEVTRSRPTQVISLSCETGGLHWFTSHPNAMFGLAPAHDYGYQTGPLSFNLKHIAKHISRQHDFPLTVKDWYRESREWPDQTGSWYRSRHGRFSKGIINPSHDPRLDAESRELWRDLLAP